MQYLVDLCTRFWKLEDSTFPRQAFNPRRDNFKEYCRKNSDILKKMVKYLNRLYDGMPPHRAGLIRLLGRPYWTRLWVLQEVQLASDLLVICGSAWLPRRVFQLCLCLLFQELSWAESRFYLVGTLTAMEWGVFTGLHPIPDFEILDTSVIKTLRNADVKIPLSKSSWWKLLLGAAELKCRDSVDYVYGLQALLAEADRIRVDYSIESGDLFWKVFMDFPNYTADFGTEAAIVQLGRKMNVTGREAACKKGTGSAERARFRIILGQDPEEIFQTQSHHDEPNETTVPDRRHPSMFFDDPEIMELLGLVDGGFAGPELSMEDQQPLGPFNSLSSLAFSDYVYSNWWHPWYAES
jgi:hypothetical protein